MKTPTKRRRQRGTTLVEALIAFLVLSLGLLATSRVERQLRLSGESARQRSEAVRLAQEDIEQLRSFASITASATMRSYADVVAATQIIDSSSGFVSNTDYRLDRQIQVSTVASARDVSVTVSWSDRAGDRQQVRLESVLAANDPALGGVLAIAPAGLTVNGPMARSARIPIGAHDLGNGRSAFAPSGSGSVIFVFDNGSGAISERCELRPGAASARSTSDLTDCERVTAYLLSGIVRFETERSTDATDRARPATVGLTLTGGSYSSTPECSTEAVATAAGDRYLHYDCIVYPLSTGKWSGTTRLSADGWGFGSSTSAARICPYRADVGGSYSSGDLRAPDSDALGSYTGVSGSLTNQNFRVLPRGLPCPG